MDSPSASPLKVDITVYFNGMDKRNLSFNTTDTVAQVKSMIATEYGTTDEAIVFIPINDPLNREAGDEGGMRSKLAVKVILDNTQYAALRRGGKMEMVYVDVGTVAFAESRPTLTHRD